MKKICTEYLEPGMILAKDIQGADGSVFLEAGALLDADAIVALEDLGIQFAYIKPDEAFTGPEAVLGRVETYVRYFFQYVDPDNVAFIELFKVVMERAVEAASKGWEIPCEHERQAKSVEHLHDLFFRDQGASLDLVKHETSLSSFPDTYFKIKEVLDSPASTAADMAKVVSADVGLTAKLLRLVNSPFFGVTGHVDSITHAVTLVGASELATLALGISAIKFFKDIPPELMDMETFWKHSLRCAVFGRVLASKVKGLKPDRFFTAGLLHDAGRLIMFKNLPYASVQAMIYARSNGLPLVDAEREVLGFDHTEVAGLLLEEWNFPAELRTIIAYHHNPEASPAPGDAAIIQLADNLACAVEISFGGMYALPGMSRDAWNKLGLDPHEIDKIFALYDKHFQELTSVFF